MKTNTINFDAIVIGSGIGGLVTASQLSAKGAKVLVLEKYMIPGLEKAEFVRFGVMHRNTFLESPKLLSPTVQFIKRENLFASGQITGTEGYAAAAAGGLLAGINASLLAKGKKPVSFPRE